jgi:hypothetical protein
MMETHASNAIARLAVDLNWRLVVLFGSLAQETNGRDADIAVLPRRLPSLLEQGHWLERISPVFSPRPVDLLLLTDGLSPLTRFAVFRVGVCLYEEAEGLFDRERDRAFFLYADSGWFRRATREMIYV